MLYCLLLVARSAGAAEPVALLLFQYCALDAFPLLGVTDWDAFNACVLRGEPTCEFRTEPVPVRIPRPYAERGGSIYEVQSLLERPFFERTDR